jgi:hypothetical protein
MRCAGAHVTDHAAPLTTPRPRPSLRARVLTVCLLSAYDEEMAEYNSN